MALVPPTLPSGQPLSLEKRMKSLARIYELTANLLNVEDTTAFLQRIAESVRELFGFDRVSISIADDARGIFTDHALAGYPQDVEEEVRGSRWAFEKDEILRDFREDCRISKIAYFIPVEKQTSAPTGFVAVRNAEAAIRPRESENSWHELDLLYFALFNRRGSMIGFLQADYPADGKLPSIEIVQEIELFATIAAVGIENSETYKRMHDLLRENEVKTDRILRLLELIQSVLRIDDVDAVLQKVSDAMAATFDFRKTSVSLFSPDSDRVTIHALTGYDHDEEQVVRRSRILKEKVLEDFKEEFRVTRTGYFIPGEKQGNGSSFVFVESPDKVPVPRKSPESWHELDLLYFGIFDRDGKMIGYIQLDYPVDQRIPTRDTMEAMEAFASIAAIAIENSAMFSDLNKAKDQVKTYLDLLTHDVGNLVTPVNAYLEIVMGTTSLSPVQFKYLSSAQEAMRSMNHLIRNVKRSAQMLETAEPEIVPTNLSKAIHSVAAEAKNAFLGKKVDVRFDMPGQDVWVMADNLVGEVIYNILTNSIKYDDHEMIVVDVEVRTVEFEGKRYAQVRVVDRGIGIPDDLKEKVFSREPRGLLRAERPAVQKAKGAGMGLSIVKALVDRYGGKIWVENRVVDDYTKGSVFNVLLPKA
ncbi:MAG: GAF domain-containing sensor histidine kinase [Thermoplasmata archaeon]